MKKLNKYCEENNKPLNLHLGCGAKRYDDYVNVDFYDSDKFDSSRGGELKADVIFDISKIEDYVDKESVSKILMVHVIEHFTRGKAVDLLNSIYRILKPNGEIVMEHPDLDGVIEFYQKSNKTIKTPLGKLNIGFTQFYGNQWDNLDYETHRYVWTKGEMYKVLTNIGFKVIQMDNNAQFHVKGRDMRVVARRK